MAPSREKKHKKPSIKHGISKDGISKAILGKTDKAARVKQIKSKQNLLRKQLDKLNPNRDEQTLEEKKKQEELERELQEMKEELDDVEMADPDLEAEEEVVVEEEGRREGKIEGEMVKKGGRKK